MPEVEFPGRFSLLGPIVVSPADGGSVSSPILVWGTSANDTYPGIPVHFHIQIATDSGFSSISIDRHSVNNQANLEYESSPGVWTALPASGLPSASIGKNVRFTLTISPGTYYWRVRTEEMV